SRISFPSTSTSVISRFSARPATVISRAVSSRGRAFEYVGAQHGDFDGDGHIDLALSTYDSAKVVIIRGLGDGTLEIPFGAGLGYSSSTLEVADLNRDGLVDLVGSQAVALGLPGGRFAAPLDIPIGGIVREVADLDHDGIPDLLATDTSRGM